MLENDNFRLELYLSIDEDEYFSIYDKKTNLIIGECGIRFTKDKANYYIGNIEYEIYKEYRGHNYAYQVTKMLGDYALSKGIDNLLISANPNNIASIKTIKKLGCRFIEVKKVPLRYRITKTDETKVAIFEWDLKERMY